MSNNTNNFINPSQSFYPSDNQVTYPIQQNSSIFMNYNPNTVNPSNTQNGLINNQLTSLPSSNLSVNHLKSSPAFLICPNCNMLGASKTDQKLSASNFCCGICFGPIIWLAFQAIRGKDINCYDAIHKCSKCGVNLKNYSAC